jgi:hypothetical protein
MGASVSKLRSRLYSSTEKQVAEALLNALKACEELLKESNAQPVHPLYTDGLIATGNAARKILAAVEKGLSDG